MGWESAASVGGGGGDTGISIAELQAELNARNITANRLNAIIRLADGLVSAMATTNGTYNHANNTNEQDALEVIAGILPEDVSFDCNALAQTTTIRIYEKVDGATYRLVNTVVYPTDVPTNVKVVPVTWKPKGRDVKVTFQSGTAEGAARSVPYCRRTGV